jgi:phosphatidate phosphatase APP1
MRPRKRPAVSNLKPHQQVTLFPSLGYFDERRGHWRLLVHGRVYTTDTIPLGTRILLGGLKRAMRATPEDVASELFQERIGGFLTKPIARRQIVLELDDQKYCLTRKSRGNGVFYGVLKIPPGQLSVAEYWNGHRSVVPLKLLRPPAVNETQVAATNADVHIVRQTGLSIVSDIDDTIKLTEATSRRQMLANTFLRPFEVVEGMAELYRQWHAMGADFHYVSSSPWQLYQSLSDLCSTSNFPAGSMHLRYFRMRDEMFRRWRPVRNNKKVGIIAALLKWLPHRKYVLVGDSGEKDPEIYRFLAKRFPEQVVAILIRNLQSHPLDAKRLRKLNAVSEGCEIRVFSNSNEIADVVERYLP